MYRGIRDSDRQPVILKVLRNPHPNFKELVQFRNQYIIIRNLDHPGILRPLALERYENGYVLVMPDDGAIALSDYWQQSNRSLAEFLTLGIQLAEALHYLTQKRIIHKDIKPANLVIHPQTRQVKAIDFSISSLLPKEQQQLLNPNLLEGTLAYISPEQTGRMNRGIDYRTDFYSLGVTFFELLTAEVPFTTDDPMELVHCHIAQAVQFPKTTEIPEMLQAIVLKLMAKNAENRYQSALGLKQDLERCLQQLEATGEITPFELGKRDRCDRFVIPEKLYGRKAEVQTLLNAFDRVANGATEIALVAGFSGIGKTAVVNEVHKPIVKQRGYFIKGKFDQLNRNIPFSAFVQAFRDLMRQLLGSSDAQLAIWKAKILDAVGENGQVLIDVIPELEAIIGQQPPVPELSGSAAQNRFNLLFRKFVRVFTSKEHPLVIFLDDLQWSDFASLNLLKLLMEESESSYLLILGAYRDNEVFPAHPLMLTLDELYKQGAVVNTLTLDALSEENITRLIADTLLCSTAIAAPLSQLVYQKTQGNPFFTTQFLLRLYEENCIGFKTEVGYWECNLGQVRQLALTTDVVEFMMARLQKLSPRTQEVLKLAACIGNEFSLKELAIVAENSPEETAVDLWEALAEGLIFPEGETYKFYLGDNPDNFQGETSNSEYRFLHDRVQQAAYSLISPDRQQSTHLKIGRLLATHTPPGELEANIFKLVSQFNAGLEGVREQKEKNDIARYNAIASRKAKTSAAYQAAWNYANIGRNLLGLQGWQNSHSLTLELCQQSAELAYLNGDFEAVEELAEIILANTNSSLEAISIYQVKIQSYFAQNRLSEGTQLGLDVLQSLGLHLPENPTEEELQQGWSEIESKLGEAAIADLVNLPLMTDPHAQAIVRILYSLYAITYGFNINLWLLTIIKQVTFSLQYGHGPTSAFAYANYGRIECSILENLDAGFQFKQLALSALSKLNARPIEAKTLLIVYFGIEHWRENLNHLLPYMKEIYVKALETGDLEVAGYGAAFYCSYSYNLGKELAELSAEIATYRLRLKEIKQASSLTHLNIFGQAVENLRQKGGQPWNLNGEIYNESVSHPIHHQENDVLALGTLYWIKSMLAYLWGQSDRAALLFAEGEKYADALVGYPPEVFYRFFKALTFLDCYSNATDEESRQQILARVTFEGDKLKKWAEYGPMNCQHKSELVEAEKARVFGEKARAIELYDRAIAGAKANDYLQEEAIANELAAKFYLDWGKEKVAAGYMTEAYYCYARWGSLAKTHQLEKKYPQLLTSILQQSRGINTSNPRISSQSLATVTTTSAFFDLTAAIATSQALSEEMELETLLSKLMKIVLENAGASKGVLVLNNGGNWEVVAQCDRSNCHLSTPLPNSPHHFPMSIINTVKQTQQSLLLNNIERDTTFSADPYLIQQRPKSLVCIPILNQGKFIGILYLENHLTVGAFTPERIEVLNLITSQAAISIENARLYQRLEEYSHNLESQVERRTQQLQENNQQLQQTLRQLQQTQAQLIQMEKMSGLGQMMAGIAHEINNPINFIAGNITHAREYVQDLFDLLALYEGECPQSSAAIQDKREEIDLEFLGQDLENLLNSMQTGSDRIKKIILGLRNFSRIQESQKKEVDIHEGLENTFLVLQHRLKPQGDYPEIVIVKNYHPLPLVNCYASQLNQVFLHVLTNAIDVLSSPDSVNSPEIRITTETGEAQTVRIRIADNGCGMSESVRQKVFDPFFTTKPVGQGTGLGLSISYQIVTEQHGGQFQCISQPGEGTEFIIDIPI